jgi:hypothetical protein
LGPTPDDWAHSTTINSLYFSSSTHGFAAGNSPDGGIVLETDDSGSSWRSVVWGPALLVDIDIVDDHGWAVGFGGTGTYFLRYGTP